ncbi:MAG: BrnT family toxin [Thiotrichaceae bacterium]
MEYQWDEAKRQANLKKHRIDFIDIVHFDWESAKVIEDDRESYGEQRFNTCGFLLGRLVIVTFTVRDEQLRIISLRKATKHEQKYYDN